MALHRFAEADINIDDIVQTVIVPDGETDWHAPLQQRLWDLVSRFRYGLLSRTVDDQLGTNPTVPLLHVPVGFEAWVHRVWISSNDATGTNTFRIGSNDPSPYNNFNSSFHLSTLATGHLEIACVYPTTLASGTTPQPLGCYCDGDDETLNTLFLERITAGVTNVRCAVLGWMHKK